MNISDGAVLKGAAQQRQKGKGSIETSRAEIAIMKELTLCVLLEERYPVLRRKFLIEKKFLELRK